MPEEKKTEIWDCQEWVRVAPLDEVREFIGWAKAVIEMRAEMATKRKRRSDAGTPRPRVEEEPIDIRKIAK